LQLVAMVANVLTIHMNGHLPRMQEFGSSFEWSSRPTAPRLRQHIPLLGTMASNPTSCERTGSGWSLAQVAQVNRSGVENV
jgi:hypothetical protein